MITVSLAWKMRELLNVQPFVTQRQIREEERREKLSDPRQRLI